MQRLEPYIIQCETLGFKRSSENNGKCALDIYKTEMQIQAAYAQAPVEPHPPSPHARGANARGQAGTAA